MKITLAQLREALKNKGYEETPAGWNHRCYNDLLASKKPEPDRGSESPDRGVGECKEGVGDNARKRKPAVLRRTSKSKVEVVITLIQSRRSLLDSHDNLRSSLKPYVDRIAGHLGVSDDDPRIRWDYFQIKDLSPFAKGFLTVIVSLQ